MAEELLIDLSGIIGDGEANLQLPDPTLLDYYKRLKNREILINQGIDDGVVEWTQEIIEWNREDKDVPVEKRKPITIYINSDGGSVNAIMELITICNLSKTPVRGIALGKAYSSGGLLLMGMPKGNRYILPTTEALIHDGYTGLSDYSIAKAVDDLEYTKVTEGKIKEFILSKTLISEEEYDKNYRKNWWMQADEIIEKGLADHIITDIGALL